MTIEQNSRPQQQCIEAFCDHCNVLYEIKSPLRQQFAPKAVTVITSIGRRLEFFKAIQPLSGDLQRKAS